MENFKIKVNSEAESKEAQELFFELGYYWAYKNIGKNTYYDKNDIFLHAGNDGILGTGTKANEVYFNNCNGKEITIQELRDMVVLKRKPMKEYLDKNRNYELVLCAEKDKEEGFIEVPDGAEHLTKCGDFIAFWKKSAVKFIGCDKDWDYDYPLSVYDYLQVASESGGMLVWQRHTQPEELPFIDDKPSLNDQYAEIEKVRQDMVNHPNHYTQGEVECIDALESATIGKSGIEAVCVANVIKYLWRYEQKNGLEDVKKAQFYLNRLVATLENNNG